MTTDHIVATASTLTGWRKSSHSGSDQGSCLEVVDGMPGVVPVRDSKDPHGPALVFPAEVWSAFVRSIRTGELPSL